MRKIEQSNAFKRDLKREASGPHKKTLQESFLALVEQLAKDKARPGRYRDHALTGK